MSGVWFQGLPALGVNPSTIDTGQLTYWFQGLPDAWFPAGTTYVPVPPHKPPKPPKPKPPGHSKGAKPVGYSVSSTDSAASIYRRDVIAPRTRHKLLSFSSSPNINLVAVSATGVAEPFTFSAGTTVVLVGVAASGAVSAFVPSLSVPLSPATAAGAAASFVGGTSVNLVAASATAAVEPFSLQISPNLALTGVSTVGVAEPFSYVGLSQNLSMAAVSATAAAVSFMAKAVSPTLVVDSYSIMSNNPVPSVGEMDNTVIANTGVFP